MRLTVPITDDPTQPVLTFRTWIIGPITCAFLAFVEIFFGFRQNPIALSSSCFQMLLVICGKSMAAALPSKPVKVPGIKWTFSMNPGPFTIKEHVLLSILVTSGLDEPNSTIVVAVRKLFYHKYMNFWAGFLMILTGQVINSIIVSIILSILISSLFFEENSSLIL